VNWTGELASDVNDDMAVMTSDEQVPVAPPPPRPTRRLTGLHGHSFDQQQQQQRASLSSAATDTCVLEETSPG